MSCVNHSLSAGKSSLIMDLNWQRSHTSALQETVRLYNPGIVGLTEATGVMGWFVCEWRMLKGGAGSGRSHRMRAEWCIRHVQGSCVASLNPDSLLCKMENLKLFCAHCIQHIFCKCILLHYLICIITLCTKTIHVENANDLMLSVGTIYC